MSRDNIEFNYDKTEVDTRRARYVRQKTQNIIPAEDGFGKFSVAIMTEKARLEAKLKYPYSKRRIVPGFKFGGKASKLKFIAFCVIIGSLLIVTWGKLMAIRRSARSI
jgi:hypothetical protein